MSYRVRVLSNRQADLEVTIDNPQLVKVLYGHGDFCSIETGAIFRKNPLPREMEKEFPSINILHDKAESVVSLE